MSYTCFRILQHHTLLSENMFSLKKKRILSAVLLSKLEKPSSVKLLNNTDGCYLLFNIRPANGNFISRK